MNIAPSRYITLISALKMIPGVKPIVTKKMLENIQFSLLEYTGEAIESKRYICGSLSLTYDDLNELFIQDDWGTPRVSPKGAQLLLHLDKEGFFERKSLEVPVELIQYIASEVDLIKAQAENDIEQKCKKELVLNTELVEEKDFSYDLLNDIFIHRFGLSRQPKSMLIGSIKVERLVSVYKSNSGKSSDSSVTFTWCSFDGQYNCIEKESIYSNNRRNDAERNWGLPD